MSEAPHRYSASVADEIERRWQQRWDEDGTFHADNPVGELRGSAESAAEAVAAATAEHPGPVHLNVGFRDPLVPAGRVLPVRAAQSDRTRPLAVAGGGTRPLAAGGDGTRPLAAAGEAEHGEGPRCRLRHRGPSCGSTAEPCC